MAKIIKLKINVKPKSFFNKVVDTGFTELFIWTMISPGTSYNFLQICWSISQKLYHLCEIIVFQKAALNPFFFTKVVDGCSGELSKTLFSMVLHSKSIRYWFILKVHIHLASFLMEGLAAFYLIIKM